MSTSQSVTAYPTARLPDEIWLMIISHLNVTDPNDIKAMKALAISCRQLFKVTSDKVKILQMFKERRMTEHLNFPEIRWTPRTLARLQKTSIQTNHCMQLVWSAWMKSNRSPVLPVQNPNTLRRALVGIIRMEGLEDNATDYNMINTYTPTMVMSLFASALLYQQCFLARYFVVIPNLPSLITLLTVRRVLRYIFLTKGPLVAANILQQPVRPGPTQNFLASVFVPEDLRPGQQVIVVGNERAGDDVQANWTLENAIVHENIDSLTMPIPAHRFDRTMGQRSDVMRLAWITGGYDPNFFGRDEDRKDLVRCMGMWQWGNPLL